MSLMAMNVLRKFAMNKKLVRAIFNEGGIFTFLRGITLKERVFEKICCEALAVMANDFMVKKEITLINPTEEVLMLLKTRDKHVQLSACKLLIHLTDNVMLREELVNQSGLQEVMDLMNNCEQVGKVFVLKVISRLCLHEECSDAFVRIGLLGEITKMMAAKESTDELKALSAETLKNIVALFPFLNFNMILLNDDWPNS